MPLVRLKVAHHGYQALPEEPLKDLLIGEAGMDQGDADTAIRRLTKGRLVDVTFDLGEDQAAKAFVRSAEALGLDGKLERDEPWSWSGSRPRPWFLKLSLAVLVGFGICVWLSVVLPYAIITKVMKVVEGLVIICWLFYGVAGTAPKTQAQADWEFKLNSWFRLGAARIGCCDGSDRF